MSWEQRIDKIIEWMTNTPKNANCVFAYFDEPDTTAHNYGPFSEQVFEKVRIADKTIGYLMEKLEEKRLSEETNLIILSDHGMAEIK